MFDSARLEIDEHRGCKVKQKIDGRNEGKNNKSKKK